jgi:hypothetical protein
MDCFAVDSQNRHTPTVATAIFPILSGSLSILLAAFLPKPTPSM